MPRTLFRLYQRKRIININVNVLLAGLVAIALAKLPVAWASAAIGPGHELLKSLVAYGIDFVVDVLVYFSLHWVANHWKPLAPLSRHDQLHRADEAPSFIRDAGRVQAERVALVPLFALVSVGGMTLLQHANVKESWAFVWAFLAAMVVTRIVHTAWGTWTGTFDDLHIQIKKRRIAARKRARANRPPP